MTELQELLTRCDASMENGRALVLSQKDERAVVQAVRDLSAIRDGLEGETFGQHAERVGNGPCLRCVGKPVG